MSDLTMPLTRMGGSDVYKRGSLKHRLESQTFARLAGGVTVTGAATETQRFKLTGLSGALNVQIAAGFVPVDGGDVSGQGALITPARIPAGGATMQLTPITNFGDKGRVMLRPVFQDPTLPVNSNNPLPMDLPFGWEFSTETDEVWIDIVVTKDWTGLAVNDPTLLGLGVVQVTIEYNGQWWDTNAIKWAIGQVQLTPGPVTPTQVATSLT